MTYNPGQSKNILVGAAAFFVSTDEYSDVPSLTASSTRAEDLFAADTANWSEVGYTDGGVEVSYEPNYGDVTVDQLLDSARIFKQGMKVMVNTTFSEATLENLLVVWGQDDSTLASNVLSMEGGALGDAPSAKSLAFVGPGPRGVTETQRVYHVNQAIQTQTTAHALKRDAATTLPVSFRCLPGTIASGGTSYGTVRDRALS